VTAPRRNGLRAPDPAATHLVVDQRGRSADGTRADERYGTIPEMVRARAAELEAHDAVLDGAVRLSFRDVERRMHAVARSLLATGVGPGDRVAIWAPNSASWIVAALGALAARAWLVPLNTRFRPSEAAAILQRVDARLVFVPAEFLGRAYAAELRATAPELRAANDIVVLPGPGVATNDAWEQFLGRGAAVPTERVEAVLAAGRADDVSDVIFTSGTTGAAKGAMLRHGASLRGFEVFSEHFGLHEGDRYIVPTPFFHCFGYKAGWMIGLLRGATTYPRAVFDPDDVLRTIERERITHMPGPPTMFWALLDHPRRDEFDLSSLRHAITGAAFIPEVLIQRMRDELGIDAILGSYGMTENHAITSLTAPDDPPVIVATTVGRVVEGVDLRIVDDEGRDVATAEAGEILVRGDYLMSGYYDDPEATARAVVDGWLHTGDIGVLDEHGYLRVTDRKKDMFIVGGFNVAPAEVEQALLGLDGVAQVAVVGMPDDYLGEVGAAFVVARDGSQLTADDVLAFAREHLANFRVPRRVELVDELPVNATGKVLKTELRARLEGTVH
jgi:acyl-CoA synthetase (AMP-forming)/AMP-acid ligase II